MSAMTATASLWKRGKIKLEDGVKLDLKMIGAWNEERWTSIFKRIGPEEVTAIGQGLVLA